MKDEFALDRARMRLAFERASDTYDDAALVQREVAERLLSRLDLIRLAPRRIADAGCGTGQCARALSGRYRDASITGFDLAHAMARHAARRRGVLARFTGRENYLCADVEALPFAAGSFDLVLSSLTLQWCNLDRAFAEIARVLAPEGLLLFSSFGPDTLAELRAAWRAADNAVHVHAFLDMHDVGDALMRAGFRDPVMDVERLTVTHANVRELLADLKHIGAHNVAAGRTRTLTGKRRFARFEQAYEAMRVDGRLPASYEIVYGHAWAPRGAVTIPVSAIGRRR
jgi:malonyl-CoA O-methyltransferase